MSAQEILLKHVCPGLGVGIALLLFLSPLPAIRRCNQTKSLGELNALPFVAMAVNCAAWIFYALLLTDYYIYFGNLPGVLLGMFYVLTCYKFSKEAAQDLLRNIFLLAVLLYWSMGLVSQAAALSPSATKTLWGATAVSVLGVYYAAPLTSIAKVVAERDSSSLHWPLCTMNIINGMLWFAYGLAIKDWFVCLPNGIGAGFNVVCLVFCFIFPPTRRKQQEQQQDHGRPGRVLEQINPAANWAALRLQSIARRPGDPDAGAAAEVQGGFFDVTQMRWRSGRLNSMKGSFIRLLSGSARGSSQLRSQNSAVAVPAPNSALQAHADLQGVMVGGDQGNKLGTADAKPAASDVEQACVVADATSLGTQQQTDQARQL